MFITFEGPEGSGKTTQMNLLADALRRAGIAVLTTREPGGAESAEEIRGLVLHRELWPETEAMLFLAARAEHARSVIIPALSGGQTVLCDRFNDSTLAYQGYGLGLDIERLRALCAFAAVDLVPDLTLFLDVPPDVGLRRRRKVRALDPDRRQEQLRLGMDLPPPGKAADSINKMEDRPPSFHFRVYEGFLAQWRGEPHRIRRIDGTRTVRQVHRAIWDEVTVHVAAKSSAQP